MPTYPPTGPATEHERFTVVPSYSACTTGDVLVFFYGSQGNINVETLTRADAIALRDALIKVLSGDRGGDSA